MNNKNGALIQLLIYLTKGIEWWKNRFVLIFCF